MVTSHTQVFRVEVSGGATVAIQICAVFCFAGGRMTKYLHQTSQARQEVARTHTKNAKLLSKAHYREQVQSQHWRAFLPQLRVANNFLLNLGLSKSQQSLHNKQMFDIRVRLQCAFVSQNFNSCP